MNRREFLTSSALAPAALSPTIFIPQENQKRPLGMKLGCQAGPLTDGRLEYLRRHSVEAVCGSPGAPKRTRFERTL